MWTSFPLFFFLPLFPSPSPPCPYDFRPSVTAPSPLQPPLFWAPPILHQISSSDGMRRDCHCLVKQITFFPPCFLSLSPIILSKLSSSVLSVGCDHWDRRICDISIFYRFFPPLSPPPSSSFLPFLYLLICVLLIDIFLT